jgi:hypothetical protein
MGVNDKDKRNLQFFVKGGGGGSAKLYYAASVYAEMGADAYSASSGSGEVSGGGVASVFGPDGSAMAGGRGGGTIKGGFGLYAYNYGTGYANGGGEVFGYGGGNGQYFPGNDAGKSKDKGKEEVYGDGSVDEIKEKDGSTGGAAYGIAFAQGVGLGNLTAPMTGSFVTGNATGMTTAFGVGSGQGSNSHGSAGGEADVYAYGNGGGSGTAGTAPINGVATGDGGQVTFEGVGYGSSSANGFGYIGENPQAESPSMNAFVIPTSSVADKGIGVDRTSTAP